MLPHICGCTIAEIQIKDCMFLSCHVRVWEWIHTLWLPECQGTNSLLETGAKSEV